MPLSSAVFRGQAEMVRFLLSRGADTSLEIEGRTVLAWAKQQKSWEIVEILEEAGAKE
jgi:ankyrin repeat protein